MNILAKRIVPGKIIYQAGIVGQVAFSALYCQGFGAENLAGVVTFDAAKITVILMEPLVALAAAKALHGFKDSGLLEKRLHMAA